MATERRRSSGDPVTWLPLNGPHLADTSAWSKARNNDALAEVFDDAVRRGLIATCDVVALELLRSARNSDQFTRQAGILAQLTTCRIGVTELQRAREVQAALAFKGHHRGVRPVDLVIAAAAEAADLSILHYDHDYDVIASVTNQPVRWLAARGSLP